MGVFATLVNGRTNIHKTFFNTYIPQSIRFANALAYESKSAVIYEPYNDVLRSYFKLAKEMA